ncbi:MAG: hypothetical protein GX938_06835, partial [Spirochaetales bacterium]|nr:hypothetical protein [Spirochaetales bacterium]
MALYFSNTGLEALLDGDRIDERQMSAWMGEAERTDVEGGAYYTKRFASGLTIIFRTIADELVGLDMHMSGRSIWTAKPLMRVGEQEPLSITMLMTSRSEQSAFIATLVHAATLPTFDDQTMIDLQVCAFVQALDIYDSRQAYEEATPTEMQVEDKKILPYNFVMSREQSLGQKERERFEAAQTLVLLAGPVIAVEKREHGWGESGCIVATVSTEMGHLDLVLG